MTPSLCRAARALLDLSQIDLAAGAGVGSSTIRNFEAGRSIPVTQNLAAIRRELERRGVVFVSPGQQSEVNAVGIGSSG